MIGLIITTNLLNLTNTLRVIFFILHKDCGYCILLNPFVWLMVYVIKLKK